MYFVCFMYHTLDSYNKARVKRMLRNSKRKYMYNTLLEKKIHRGGPAHFKPVLFKGQLYTPFRGD